MIGFFARQIFPLVAPLCSARQPFSGSTQLPKGSALIEAIARHARGEIKMSAGGIATLACDKCGHTAEFELTEEQTQKRRAGSVMQLM